MNAKTFDPQTLTQSPLQFDISCDLDAKPESVFAVLADFANLPQWMPLMKRVEVDNSQAKKPGEVGAVRVIYPPLGPATRETVKAFERPWLLSYSAADENLFGMWTDHTGILTCEDNGKGGTSLRWRTYALPGKNPFMRVLGRLVFSFVFRSSLAKLQQRFSAKA